MAGEIIKHVALADELSSGPSQGFVEPPYYATRIQSSDEFLAPISPSRAAKSRDGIHTCRHRICPSIESDHWA